MERSRSGRGEQLCCGWGLLWEGDSTQPLTLGSAGLQGGDSWQICPSPACKANHSLARRVSKCPNRVRMRGGSRGGGLHLQRGRACYRIE